MCGIWCYFNGTSLKSPEKNLKHRGPDDTNSITTPTFSMGFTHLAINGKAVQPFYEDDLALVCNGEIYNYRELATLYNIPIKEGDSDCSILPALFRKCTTVDEFCRVLDGEFSIIIVDRGVLTVVRDPFGVRPLFENRNSFASEAKAFEGMCRQFPPGMYLQHGLYTRYHTLPRSLPTMEYDIAVSTVRSELLRAVQKRTISDKPIGALLSGGLDSSLVVAILSKSIPNLKTFSIGLADSEDLKYAAIVAKHCRTNHHQITITEKQYQDAIPLVISAIESADVTTVRASVGNWLLGKYIKANTNIKVVLNGDGSDEVCGGYKYFKRSPSMQAFDTECRRLLGDIHFFDGLRSDRCISAHGLEPRTPYLDKGFVDAVLSVPIEYRFTTIEKALLRNAFRGYLPDNVLYRRKEAFSDGMSQNVPWKTIPNEEAYYKQIYDSMYPAGLVPYKWMPRWCPETSDPSAKTICLTPLQGKQDTA